ncbi:lipopolysaccharide transport periplasmic protein LptA [Aquisalimonas lutea]|uniref:lipopolysaccharide transport periplasmic protein LptA n=1 Tax=Aquisalimonas lutea TaxID=1327750 RepID=UPI0025B28DA9|nr:lipopolysaccharide transport periplasmic protein LptA [Aquisalimonas lutea]MDN3517378.1 lipopolysaccharide transport periplasmic protein LptA [Aquisalimonas lutea]
MSFPNRPWTTPAPPPSRRGRAAAGLGGLLLAALAAPVTPAAAAERINLDADRAEINNATGVSVYTGDVVLTRGGRRITGERMTVYLDGSGDQQTLDHVVVEGEPAVYTQQGTEERRPVEAEAPRMEYYASGPERVILLNGGKVVQGRNTFTGERIEYNVTADVVDARSEPDSDRRVQITLFPEDDGDGESE